MARTSLMIAAVLTVSAGYAAGGTAATAPGPPDGDRPPVALMSARFLSHTELVFSAEQSIGGYENPIDVGPTARWSFGDGATAKGETVRHRYARRGRFVVTLTVRDPWAREDTSRHVVDLRRVRRFSFAGKPDARGVTVTITCHRVAVRRCAGRITRTFEGAKPIVGYFFVFPGRRRAFHLDRPDSATGPGAHVKVEIEEEAIRPVPRIVTWTYRTPGLTR